MFNLIRLALLNRSHVINSVQFSRFFSSNDFLDRHRRDLMEKFDETNAEVFDQLKKLTRQSEEFNWTELRSKLIKEHPRTYNQYNFEVQFMQHLLKIGKQEDKVIKSFINHVKQLLVNQSNKVVQCHLIRFLLIMEKHPDVNYVRDALETIIKDEFFIKYPVVGKAWAEFSRLSREACEQSIDFATKHLVLQTDALTTLLVNTLEYGMFQDAENLLTNYNDRKLSDEVVSSWMKALGKLDAESRTSEFDRFVKILCTKRYLFQKSMLFDVESFLHSCGYYFKTATIDSVKCSCKECGSPFQTISSSEVIKLQSAVEQRLINKHGEIYIVTTPMEMESFNRFMASHSSQPFDLVIDGLNVSYYNTSRAVEEDKKTHSLSIKNLGLSESLYETMEINDIFGRFKKILVIGRKHMNGWPSIKQLKENHPGHVWVYLLDNKSEDDVFTIAAAVKSPKTYIWTADFLRQYKELLSNDYGYLFEKWKYCRQIRFAPGSKRILEFPNNVDYICQKSSVGQYHFPINMNTRVDSQERIIAHWMCIGKSLT